MDKRELINIVAPALRGLTAPARSLGVLRYEDSQAHDSCDLRIALPTEASTAQIVDALRQTFRPGIPPVSQQHPAGKDIDTLVAPGYNIATGITISRASPHCHGL